MFSANVIFILSMRIIIEICNKFPEITFLLFAYISLRWVQCRDLSWTSYISKGFHSMDQVLHRIKIPHDLDADEIPVQCPWSGKMSLNGHHYSEEEEQSRSLY